MIYLPLEVSQLVASMYFPAVYAGLIVAFIGFTAIAMQKKDLHILILTDIVGLAMLMIVSAVGTDLAEALLLPGLVVELAEILAISEILISRETHRIKANPKRELPKGGSIWPLPFVEDMEVLTTSPNFLALILIAYGIFLSGFTGGAIAGAGVLFYAFSRKARGLPIFVLDGIAGISGVAWCLWIIGFVLFFLKPELWLLSLFLSALGLLLKVGSKVGLIGVLMREEYEKK